MNDDSDIDILVIAEAPKGVFELKLEIGRALPRMGFRWTDIVVLTPRGLRKRLVEWEKKALERVSSEATVLHEAEPQTSGSVKEAMIGS